MDAATGGPPGPFRVALFCGNYNYTRDGANQTLNRLVAHLAERGCEVRVYSPTTPTPAFPPAGGLLPTPSVTIPFRSDYRFATGLPRAMRPGLVEFAPDIVHLSTPDLLGWHAMRIARRLKVPVVASLHTRFETYLRYYGLGWLRRPAESYLRAFYRRCDFVLAPSRPVAEALLDPATASRIRIWSRGVDRRLFDPRNRDMDWRRAQGFADDDIVLLFLGRLVKEKGLAVFAESAARAAARDPRIRVLVVGDGPARRWFARRLPGGVFTGMLTGERLGRAVASADVMLNPSLTEAFGNVTLEAMAAGLPVVCADAPAHRALVAPQAGRLRPPDDAAAFAEAILELAADPAQRRELGAAARRAAGRYRWPEALDSVLAVYAEARSDRAASASIPPVVPA